jgi:hypothetical protein
MGPVSDDDAFGAIDADEKDRCHTAVLDRRCAHQLGHLSERRDLDDMT